MIIPVSDRDRFLIVSKVPLEDTRLSWKARGLLCFLLSKPPNWTIIVKYLVDQAPDGRDSVMAGLSELEKAGYIQRQKRRSDSKRFDGIDSFVFEEPRTEPYIIPDDTVNGFSGYGKAVNGKSDTNEEGLLVNTEPTTSSKTFDEEVISLTTLLADLIEQNGSKRPAVTNKWRNEIRLLRDKDQHSCRQIENMIRWCQADSFWRANILSATKLRAKYDQMRLRALAEDPRTKELEHQEASAAPVDDDWEEELERRRLESAPPPTNFAKTIREQMNGETP